MTHSLRISHEERKRVFTRVEKRVEKRAKREEGKKRCWNGGKVSFTTRKKAIKALGRARRQAVKDRKGAVQAVYLCPFCKLWHMTKNPQRKGAETGQG